MGPVVVVVALGWFVGTKMDFDVQTLSRVSFWILGPAFAFDVFEGADISGGTVIRLVIASLSAMVVAGAVGGVLARALGFGSARRSAVIMTSSYGNVGNTGLAISVFAFGDAVAPIAALLMITINITGMTMGVALGSAQSRGLMPAIQRGLTAPMTLAAVAALIVNFTGAGVPTIAERSISMVGAALIPVMLLTLGMQLAQKGLPRPEADAGITALAKLVVAPLIAALVGNLFGLSGAVQGVLVLQSAMPPAVFCAVVALEYDLEPERVSRTVVATTVLALLTIPVALVAVT
jgi:predicted permease